MPKRTKINIKELKEAMHYDPETGVFTWRVRPRKHFASEARWARWNTQYSGKAITTGGVVSGKRIIHIVVTQNGQRFQSSGHIMAILYVTGKPATGRVTHKNGIGTDNRFSNLKVESIEEQCRRMKMYKTNTSGRTGVCYHILKKKWCTSIGLNNRRVYGGQFDCEEDAIK